MSAWIAMSVPGDRDDGADTGWHVYNRETRRSRKIGSGAAACRTASTEAARLNGAS